MIVIVLYLNVEIGCIPCEAVPPGVELGEGLQQAGQQRPEVLRHHQLTSGGLARGKLTPVICIPVDVAGDHLQGGALQVVQVPQDEPGQVEDDAGEVDAGHLHTVISQYPGLRLLAISIFSSINC